MAGPTVRKEAFWLYGVIAALAIREALLSVVAPPTPIEFDPIHYFRLASFILLLTQGYLGAATYFDDVHGSDEPGGEFPDRSFGVDFLTGLLHTLLFFWWGTTITDPTTNRHHYSPFLIGLLLTQGTCLAWVISGVLYSTLHRLGVWAVLNAVTAGLTVAAFSITSWFMDNGNPWREAWALVPALFVNAVQLGELFKGKRIIAPMISRLFKGESAKSAF